MSLGTAARQTDYSSAGRAMSSGLDSGRMISADFDIVSSIRSTLKYEPRLAINSMVSQPGTYASLLTRMPDDELGGFYRALSDADQTKFRNGLINSGNTDLLRKIDTVSGVRAAPDAGAARAAGTPDAAAARAAGTPDADAAARAAPPRPADRAPTDAAEAKARKGEPLTPAEAMLLDGRRARNINTGAYVLGAGGLVAGAFYLDSKFNKADEDTKNCIKVCLPENWDEYQYGSLKKDQVRYRTISDGGEHPVCTEKISDCDKYCEERCTAIHAYKPPGQRTLEGLGGNLLEMFTDGIKTLFDGLFGDLGIDFSQLPIFSSVSSLLLVLIFVILPMAGQTKK